MFRHMQSSLYIHWPFCLAKCPYCDFNSHVSNAIDHLAFEKAYLMEINNFAQYLSDKTITSIFFGGGTPSLMQPKIVESIINELAKTSKLSENIEITLEANPTSVESDKFRDFKKAGINRVSLGIQSLDNDNLKFLGREHNAEEALNALDKIKIFDNYSFDLIYALPNQTLEQWQKELELALQHSSHHLSLYQLTIEKGTKFHSDYKANKFIMPKDDLAADFYNLTTKITKDSGFNKYEVSNYALEGYESKHNMGYWQYSDYLGIGAGAHSRITTNSGAKKAMTMFYNPQKWQESVKNGCSAIQSETILDDNDILIERLIMGLRLKIGVDFALIKAIEKSINPNIQKTIDSFIENKLLTIDNNHLKTTKEGCLVLNGIIAKLV